MLQEEMQKERRLKRKILELKQTIRVLMCVLLVFVLATTALALLLVYPWFNKANTETLEEAGRFEGEHRLEEYTLQCEYKSKAEETGVFVYTTDVLKFAGEGYEKVAATIEEYFGDDDFLERLQYNYDLVTMSAVYESTRLECTRMDDTVVSIKRLHHFYESGGFYIQDGKTFSVKTGKLLELDDLLKDKKGFYNLIDELILAQIPVKYPRIEEECPDYKDIYRENYSENGKLPEWHLDNTGIAFSFEEGEMLSKGAILPEVCMMVVVPYEQVSAYLKPEYIVQGE